MLTFSDLMRGHLTAEILCYRRGTIVRRLTVKGDTVNMDAITESIDIPLTTPIAYEPWFMDRGSMLFNGNLKLCTEGDTIRFPDGQTFWVGPDSIEEREDEGTSDAGERCY
jgi:hypothetical protein